jgi:hypothetical protein
MHAVKVRSVKNYCANHFCDLLANANWNEVTDSDNVDSAWSAFKSIFISILDKVAPIKETRVKQRSEPWFDLNIAELIKQRDLVLMKYRRHSDPIVKLEYKKQFNKLRNKVQYLLKKAKNSFFVDNLEKNKNNPTGLWKTLKNLGLPTKSVSSSATIGLQVGEEISFEKTTVAETFNNFFTNVASNLVSKLPIGPGLYGKHFVREFYSRQNVKAGDFALTSVKEEEILKLLKNVSTKKATGLDSLPARFLKDASENIVSPISHIINLSVKTGIVPNELKLARVVPLHKKGSTLCEGNYRPVSILSIMSKVLERVIYNQLESYLSKNNLIYNLQSGFRQGYSTDTCLIYLTDYIKNQMEEGKYTGLVMLDLQKAFDTVDHKILLDKLEALGVDDMSVSWFKSYLCERKQVVDINGTISEMAKISCGVPQGSILGPLLFLVYVNDMKGVTDCNLILYADDSALMISDKDVTKIEQKLEIELKSVCDWLIDNKLSIHLGKTESILFGSSKKLKKKSKLNISCNGISIASQEEVKYLGAKIDQSMSGSVMASNLLKKAGDRMKFLYRQKHFLTRSTKRFLVSALIQCHFDYSCSWWYPCLTQNLKTRLQTMQNKMIRFVMDFTFRTHIGHKEFKDISWLPVEHRVQQIMLCHMHKIMNNRAPDYLGSNIVSINQRHSYNTRSSVSGLIIDRVGSFGRKTFNNVAKHLWNALPNHFCFIEDYEQFKIKVKYHYLNKIKEKENSMFI